MLNLHETKNEIEARECSCRELELANEGFMGVSLGDLVKGDIQTATVRAGTLLLLLHALLSGPDISDQGRERFRGSWPACV